MVSKHITVVPFGGVDALTYPVTFIVICLLLNIYGFTHVFFYSLVQSTAYALSLITGMNAKQLKMVSGLLNANSKPFVGHSIECFVELEINEGKNSIIETDLPYPTKFGSYS